MASTTARFTGIDDGSLDCDVVLLLLLILGVKIVAVVSVIVVNIVFLVVVLLLFSLVCVYFCGCLLLGCGAFVGDGLEVSIICRIFTFCCCKR